MLRLIALLGLGCVLGWAQLPENFTTQDKLNGRFWRSITQSERLTYLAGFGENQPCNGADSPAGATNGEIPSALNTFYQLPENLAIPIGRAIEVFALKLKGTDTASIDRMIVLLRAAAATERDK